MPPKPVAVSVSLRGETKKEKKRSYIKRTLVSRLSPVILGSMRPAIGLFTFGLLDLGLTYAMGLTTFSYFVNEQMGATTKTKGGLSPRIIFKIKRKSNQYSPFINQMEV